MNRRYTATAGIPGKAACPSGKKDASKYRNLLGGRVTKAHAAEGDDDDDPVARQGQGAAGWRGRYESHQGDKVCQAWGRRRGFFLSQPHGVDDGLGL